MTKPAYSVEEFCRAYAISRTTFYRQANLGRILPSKCGRRTLVSRAAAERWLKHLPVYRSRKRISVRAFGGDFNPFRHSKH